MADLGFGTESHAGAFHRLLKSLRAAKAAEAVNDVASRAPRVVRAQAVPTSAGTRTLMKSLMGPVGQLACARRQQSRVVFVHPSPEQILAKAQSAFAAGRITGTEAAKVETALGMGLVPDRLTLARLFGGAD